MKIERLFIYCLLAGTSFFASCSNEEMTDNQVEALPEGMYPLTFTATQDEVVATPQTRVTDYDDTDGTHKSKWNGGDRIKVTVKENSTGKESITTCTLNESGNITSYNPQLYWQTTGNHTINAWYSNISGQNTTNNTVGLSDQRSRLAYVLQADELTEKNYQSGSLQLFFRHKLAKVRVKVVPGSYAGALNVTAVSVKGYTSCTVSNGDVSPSGNLNSIQMEKNDSYWEANLVPGTGALGNVITIDADGKSTTCTLASAVNLTAAQIYTYEVTVNQAGPTSVTDGQTITKPGDYIMTGSYTQTVTLNGDNIELTLNNVTINASIPIKIASGTPTINVVGNNNSLTATEGPGIWVDGDNTNIKITGSGSPNSCLNITSTGAAIGTKSFPDNNPKCGNINIEYVKIKANVSDYGASAIGFGRVFSSSSQNKIGDITITNSEIEAILSENKYFPYGAVIGGCGGGEGSYQMGNIRITPTDPVMTPQKYFNNCTCGNVLVGFPSSDELYNVNSFKIYWNGEEQNGNITK